MARFRSITTPGSITGTWLKSKRLNHKGHEGTQGKLRDFGDRMPDEKTFHMTPEEFRKHGHAVVDWIADYYSRIESYPVLSRVKPGEIRASLPANPPTNGESFENILADIEKLIVPGVTHSQSPNFFAF